MVARILLLADTHLGFDLPMRPRVQRRRRGHDFFQNFERVLADALERPVDAVVHGGDLFYRSRIPAALVQRAFLPLKSLADRGIPIFLVPGNHERSRIPYPMLAQHPNIRIFDRPRTHHAEIHGVPIAFVGFPYQRRNVRRSFPQILEAAGWPDTRREINFLCVHHCFEGATVGPKDYTFRYSDDVIRHADVPAEFAAVLTGHVHRHQVLTHDLLGRSISVPVLYPGSIERTAFAEMGEPKGYVRLEARVGQRVGGELAGWDFCRLPTRPMLVHNLRVDGLAARELESTLQSVLAEAPVDAVLRLRVHGRASDEARTVLAVRQLRALAPPTMNIELVFPEERGGALTSAGLRRGD